MIGFVHLHGNARHGGGAQVELRAAEGHQLVVEVAPGERHTYLTR